jgi:hypothetical protein
VELCPLVLESFPAREHEDTFQQISSSALTFPPSQTRKFPKIRRFPLERTHAILLAEPPPRLKTPRKCLAEDVVSMHCSFFSLVFFPSYHVGSIGIVSHESFYAESSSYQLCTALPPRQRLDRGSTALKMQSLTISN